MPGIDHRLRFESFGVCAELISDDRGVFEAMREALPPGWRTATAEPGATFRVKTTGEVIRDERALVRRARQPESLVTEFTSALRQHIAENAPDHVFIHAGVVGVDGAAIVIPGKSFSGKTTLVAELVDRGATYYSDEYAVVGDDGLIQPFAQPLSLRPPDSAGGRAGERAGGRDRVPIPHEQTGRDPIRAGVILVTSYEPGADWEPRTGTAAEGASALFENTVQARLRPRQAMRAVSLVARGVAVFTGARGEARQLAEVLLTGTSLIRLD